MGELHVFEKYGVTHRRSYSIEHRQNKWETREENLQYKSLRSFFFTAFLPYGYPDSVSKDYLQYQFWDSIQAFASSITGSVCTHAILKGAGVGDENATPYAATITWLLKDGVSMIGRIGFAWMKGTKLDMDCKKWRLFADVMNDAAMFMDLVSAYFQNHFMLIACVSGLMKSLVGVAGGCTRAALTQHQARKNNMADVSAKDGSQETLVNLVALFCSLLILPIVTKSFVLTWVLYFSMTILHLSANYLAVKSVVMETFNEARFKIFTGQYLKDRKCLTVSEVNQREALFFGFQDNFKIMLGSSFSNIISGRRYEEVKEVLKVYNNCDFLLRVSVKSNSDVSVFVTFNSKANVLTHLEAFYQACWIKHCWQTGCQRDSDIETYLEVESREKCLKSFPFFKKKLEAMEFNIKTAVFNIDLWSSEWQ